MSRSGRFRSVAVNALLAVASSTLFVGSLEMVSRAFERTSPDETAEKLALWEKAWNSDFYVLTSHSPGWPPFAAVNRDGLPDRLHTVERTEGSFRIAILGDSVTAGTPFKPEESWPHRLQAMADERGPFVEIMNVALWGWSTRQERTAYSTIVRRYRPDLVVVALCLNDIEELQNNLSRPTAALGWLHRRSALVRRLVDAEGRSIRMVEDLLTDSPNVRSGFERLFVELEALHRDVRADNAVLTVVVLPMQAQVERRSSSRLPQEAIGSFCKGAGIPFVDPLASLDGQGGLFEDVVHLTTEGRRVLAEALFPSLIPSDRLARLVVPPRAASSRSSALPLVFASTLSSTDPRDRAEAAWALGLFPPPLPEAPRVLGRLLHDPSPMVRSAAAAALARLGPEANAALPWVLGAMTDSCPSVRWRATEALVALRTDLTDVEAVARHLTSQDIYVRAGAAFALHQMGPSASRALPGLRQLLADDDEGVRAMAVQAVAAVGRGDSTSVGAFLAVLAGPPTDGNARWKAARALGRLGKAAQEAVPSLISALDDPNGHVRREAATALGRIGVSNPATMLALRHASRDSWPPVRRAVATALGHVGCHDPRALEALRTLTKDDAAEAREAALAAVRQCQPE